MPAFRCASVNGITQTARSRSRINALQIRCALMECLVCFFIFYYLMIFELRESTRGRIEGGSPGACSCRDDLFAKKSGGMSTLFLIFLKIFGNGNVTGCRNKGVPSWGGLFPLFCRGSCAGSKTMKFSADTPASRTGVRPVASMPLQIVSSSARRAPREPPP